MGLKEFGLLDTWKVHVGKFLIISLLVLKFTIIFLFFLKIIIVGWNFHICLKHNGDIVLVIG